MTDDSIFSEAVDAPPKRRALPISDKRRMPDSQPERELFGRNVRRARHEAGLKQAELSKLSGIAQAHVSDLENARQNVCIDSMVKLAKVLKKPVYEFLMP